MTFKRLCCSDTSFSLFCCSRLIMFSTTIIASSTSTPRAIAIPPSVIVLIVISRAFSRNIVENRDKGIAISVISVALILSKNSNTIMTTKTAPSRNAFKRLPIAASIKEDCLNRSFSIFIPSGRLL